MEHLTRINRRDFCYILSLSGVAHAASISASTPSQLPAHPRLHLDSTGWSQLKSAIASDPRLQAILAKLQKHAEALLKDRSAEYKLIGPRLLNESRRALERISTFAGLYRLDADPRKLEAARNELTLICKFPDWHPPHFLDVAELTNAAGIGYDWLYNELTDSERKTIREKIIAFGLKAGLKQYADNAFWAKPHANNWGLVCNGGLTVGALAVLHDDPSGPPEALKVLEIAPKNVMNAMEAYAPDGGWIEGPGYWHYASNYGSTMMAAMQSATGSDHGISDAPGFAQSGLFRVHSMGPALKSFNYADAHDGVEAAQEMYWLARRFQQPLFADSETRVVQSKGPSIFHLVWASGANVAGSPPLPASAPNDAPPLDAHFKAIDVAFMRSSWTDPRAFYVGIKGGDNRASHGHLDLGTFVFDALGQRWALDLGPDDYDLPEYFGKLRFTYYRLRTEAHNTLTLGTENQALAAKAHITSLISTPSLCSVDIDLSEAYAPMLTNVTRRLTLDREHSTVRLEDTFKSAQPVPVRWNLHTAAEIVFPNGQQSGPQAVLHLGGEQMPVRILSPAGAVFEVISCDAPPPQAQQPNVRNLVVNLQPSAGISKLVVEFG